MDTHTIVATADILDEDGTVLVKENDPAAIIGSILPLEKLLAGLQTGRLKEKSVKQRDDAATAEAQAAVDAGIHVQELADAKTRIVELEAQLAAKTVDTGSGNQAGGGSGGQTPNVNTGATAPAKASPKATAPDATKLPEAGKGTAPSGEPAAK